LILSRQGLFLPIDKIIPGKPKQENHSRQYIYFVFFPKMILMRKAKPIKTWRSRWSGLSAIRYARCDQAPA